MDRQMASKQKRKRERKKRARKQHTSTAGGEEPRGFTYGPLSVVQEGVGLQISVDHDHPDYEAFHAAQKAQIDETPARALKLREEIVELCAPFHAFDVVLGVWMAYGKTAFDSLKPLHTDGFPRAAEYVSHVLLDRDGPEPERLPSDGEMRRGIDPLALGHRVKEIIDGYPVWFYERQRAEGDEGLDPWLELRTRLYMHRLAVGSFTYEWQEEETLHHLFDPFGKELTSAIGFDAAQALALEQALAPLVFKGIGARATLAKESGERFAAAIAAKRKGLGVPTDMPENLVSQLAALPKADAARWIKHLQGSWIGLAAGQDASFTAEELAQAADVPAEVAKAFLTAFSVRFGHRCDKAEWEEDPIKAVGGELEVMRSTPILDGGDARYLPAAYDTVLYGIRDVLTEALKLTKVWPKFDRHRAKVLEQRAVEAIAARLKADWSHTGVEYRFVDEDGEEKKGEADGVIRAGTLAVLVEAKAGGLAPSARRTAPARLERALNDLLVSAHNQLQRSQAALVRGQATAVTDQAGGALALDFEGVSRTLRIAVSLEDLSPFAPTIWQLQAAGLLPSDERAPWVVGIHELELICDLSAGPAQFVHYVLRRQRAIRQHLWAMDEMDFFMKYLKDGLFFDDAEIVDTGIELHSHTDELDEYLYGERGLRPKTKRPKQKIAGPTRELLRQIAGIDSPGKIEAEIMILEMDDEGRKQIASGIRRLERMVAADHKPHDLTLPFQDDFAVSVHCVPPALKDELPARLRNHGEGRSAHSNLRRWLGLGVVHGDRGRIQTMTVMLDPTRLEDE